MKLLSYLFVSIVLLGMVACNQENVVATYNGGTVTDKEVEEQLYRMGKGSARAELPEFAELDPTLQKDIVREAVVQELIARQAKAAKIDQDEKVKNAVELFKNNLIAQEFLSKKADMEVTEELVQKEYEKIVESYKGKEEVRASHILVNEESEAKKIRQQLVTNRKQFTKLAKAHSQDPGTKDRGGDLGYFVKGQMVKPFEEAVFALKKGQISKPVQSQFGWHIIQLQDRRPAKPAQFESVKSAITQQLKQQLLSSYLTQMLEDADIEFIALKTESNIAEAAEEESVADTIQEEADAKATTSE